MIDYEGVLRRQAEHQGECMEFDLRRLRCEQEVQAVAFAMQMQAEAMGNLLMLAFNPNINAEQFADLSRQLFRPDPP